MYNNNLYASQIYKLSFKRETKLKKLNPNLEELLSIVIHYHIPLQYVRRSLLNSFMQKIAVKIILQINFFVFF